MSNECDAIEKENDKYQSQEFLSGLPQRELRSCESEKMANVTQLKVRGKNKAVFEGPSNPRKKRLRSCKAETGDTELSENTISQPPRELRRSQRRR